jgi:hypothetical protein
MLELVLRDTSDFFDLDFVRGRGWEEAGGMSLATCQIDIFPDSALLVRARQTGGWSPDN